MAKLKITHPDGTVYEVSDISFEEVNSLIHRTGSRKPGTRKTIDLQSLDNADYKGFWGAITDKAKEFFIALHKVPDGIPLDVLAAELSFDNSMKVGGVTGGGIAKLAPKFGLRTEDLYQRVMTRKKGERIVIYKPGKDMGKLPLK